MKRKIIALFAALAVGVSAFAYAATAGSQSPAAAACTGTVKTAAVLASAKSACPTAQAVPGKTTAAVKNASAPVKGTACQSGSCASSSACKANSCTNGTACPSGNCTVSGICGTSAAKETAVSTANGTACAKAASSCSAGSACPGTNCGTVSVCGGSGCDCGSLLNGILNGGKTCSGASCSSAKPALPKTAPSAAPAPASSFSAFQNEVVGLVNAERAKNGLSALTADADLMKTATLKSQDMAKNNYFDHTSPTYGSPFDLMTKYGVSSRAAGENIAMGQTSPSQVMNAWMNSSGHRANILSASYTQIGVGVAQNSAGTYYWTQHFIG